MRKVIPAPHSILEILRLLLGVFEMMKQIRLGGNFLPYISHKYIHLMLSGEARVQTDATLN